MKERIILITKDVLMRGYLPTYGNTYNHTPNIDELAAQGTVFLRHYTAAPSTAMSFTSMCTGLYAYQTKRKKYVEVSEFEGETLMDKLYDKGYECHVIWDRRYVKMAQRFSKCFGRHTQIHNTDLTKSISPHVKGQWDEIVFNKEQQDEAKQIFDSLLHEITDVKNPVFVWVHFPHTISGTNVWGSDINLFDEMIGIARKYFPDNGIYISADHGHMNGEHGKYGYGFDVYESAIQIPLVTPRLDVGSTIEFPTSNIQLQDIILEGKVEKLDYVISETAYYMQPHRKIAIIADEYKLIYEKATKRTFLYDVIWDPQETTNLISPDVYDNDRKKEFPTNQRWFYNKWEKARIVSELLSQVKNALWRNGTVTEEIQSHIMQILKTIYGKYKK